MEVALKKKKKYFLNENAFKTISKLILVLEILFEKNFFMTLIILLKDFLTENISRRISKTIFRPEVILKIYKNIFSTRKCL